VKNIIFIFNKGRQDRLKTDPDGPKEFFYTFNKFKKNYNNVGLIESSSNHGYLLKYIFLILRKFSKLPIYTETFLKTKNLKKLFSSDIWIATNQNLGFSMYPIILIKTIVKRTELYTFAMGLLENDSSKLITNKLFKNYLRVSKSIFFISKSEYLQAQIKYPKYNKKFKYVPFCIDTNFWQRSSTQIDEKNILFIGNDMNRNYDLVVELAKSMPEYKFIFISEQIKNLNIPNVELINGNWNKALLSDQEIRNYYQKSFLTILPINNTFQPSGQSVTLQSMSMETPVLITKTDGFWDEENFQNNKNIYFIENNDLEKWKSRIKKIYEDEKLHEFVKKEGKKTINNNFYLDFMYHEVKKIINF